MGTAFHGLHLQQIFTKVGVENAVRDHLLGNLPRETDIQPSLGFQITNRNILIVKYHCFGFEGLIETELVLVFRQLHIEIA